MRRTKEAAEQTREGILDAAERVFFEHGVAHTTLEQIAQAAAVTRGAIYWHFRNKAELFNALVARVRMPMENALYRLADGAETLSDIQEFCIQSLKDVHNDPRLQRVYTILLLKCEYTEDMPELIKREQAVRDDIIQALIRYFSRLQSAGTITTNEEPRILAHALHAYILGLYIMYLQSPHQFNMPKDAIKLVEPFFTPLTQQST